VDLMIESDVEFFDMDSFTLMVDRSLVVRTAPL